jgi:hypothetical protein
LSGQIGKILTSSRKTMRVSVEMFARETVLTLPTDDLEVVEPD